MSNKKEFKKSLRPYSHCNVCSYSLQKSIENISIKQQEMSNFFLKTILEYSQRITRLEVKVDYLNAQIFHR